jgi:SAM-dependent methyltransferase
MNGRVPIIPNYVDYTYPSNWPSIYTDEEIDSYMQLIRANGTYIYGSVDDTVQEAFRRYPIKGLEVVTMGSMTPWYEAMILVHGGRAHCIDYNPIIVRSSRMKAWTTAQWERERLQFDYALSISSFEHNGLGAFGDPLDPDGDLKAMRKMKQILKPGGILLLAVPTGKDALHFNLMRVYGRLRMPLMLEGWEWIDSVAFEDRMYDARGEFQPILILRNS